LFLIPLLVRAICAPRRAGSGGWNIRERCDEVPQSHSKRMELVQAVLPGSWLAEAIQLASAVRRADRVFAAE
jgi:hypothetical protein